MLAGTAIALLACGSRLRPLDASTASLWLQDPLDPAVAGWTFLSFGWLLWAMFGIGTVACVLAGVRQAWRPHRLRLRLPGPVRSLHAALLGVAAVSSVGHTSAPAVAASTAHTGHDPAAPFGHHGHQSSTHQIIHTKTIELGQQAAPTAVMDPGIPAWARHAPGGVHHVIEGDTLWDIAQRTLGDPRRWHEIFRLNHGHEQANGYALTDPDQLHIGWDLALPARINTTQGKTPVSPTDSRPAPAPESGPTANKPTATTATPGRSDHASEPAPSIPSSSPDGTSTPADTSSVGARAHAGDGQSGDESGIPEPVQGWASLGLACLITAVAALVRLQRRRHARLTGPMRPSLAPHPAPLPEPLAHYEATGPLRPALAAPIGTDSAGQDMSLFDLPGPGLALHGDGGRAAARALLAAVLATGTTGGGAEMRRPVVVTTTGILAQLLPKDAPLVGLDPDGISYDGERLIVLGDAAAAVAHAEQEVVRRRRLLDTLDAETIAALNARTDHAEGQAPYALLVEADLEEAARILAIGAYRAALDMYPVVLGPLDGLTTLDIAVDGTTTNEAALGLRRLSTMTAGDLAAVLVLLAEGMPRPEAGHDIDTANPGDVADPVSTSTATQAVPAQAAQIIAPIRLQVLGPVRITTDAGPVTTGMRSGSYTVLASLAVHSAGRTLDQLAADLHPDTAPAVAVKRVRTDITTARRVLRTSTGNADAMFIVYDCATGRYQLDPALVTVDLWQLLTAIERANTATGDARALAALREAADLYGGDFAEGQDRAWIIDYANSYRHQILAVYARIAEIIETDHPDEAIAALEHAIHLDPVNEELHQRIMRIHGRAHRPEAVRNTLRRLEQHLADLDTEPSDATRRVADRQLHTYTFAGGHR
ncbi:BTAD domain-containing putative transcriptional regulator [Paractinoplanes globisporus]|uniref:BTAD domain-containing putative transcriptional regulator n=1 Tax=Paractinoplanes globisporus TaxID=113565 RepID=A0ABW6WI98_9ACTN|nr:BTAD domain-containing putative transcriptional regulator [Actinoplanes globisporus]